MAAPVFIDAGAGVSNASGTTLTPACPATVAAGDCLLLQCINWDETETILTPLGWTKLSGPDTNVSLATYLFGRIADGTESGATVSVVWSAAASEHSARIYRFSGTDTDATFWESLAFVADVGTTVSDVGVTTLGADRLAVNAVGLGAATTIGSFTGETGGDWTEAVAEYAANNLALQLQTAAMATAGTIDGGTATAGLSTRILSYGLALKPYEPVTPATVGSFPTAKIRSRRTSW